MNLDCYSRHTSIPRKRRGKPTTTTNNMYLGATLLDMQAFAKTAEYLRVLIFSLVLTTLLKTAICYSVYRRRKYAKILLVVQRPVSCRQKEFVCTLKLFRRSRHLASCCAFSTFAIAKSFFGALYNTSAFIGSS